MVLDVNTINNKGETTLFNYRKNRNEETAKTFIRYSANINKEDNESTTQLQVDSYRKKLYILCKNGEVLYL